MGLVMVTFNHGRAAGTYVLVEISMCCIYVFQNVTQYVVVYFFNVASFFSPLLGGMTEPLKVCMTNLLGAVVEEDTDLTIRIRPIPKDFALVCDVRLWGVFTFKVGVYDLSFRKYRHGPLWRGVHHMTRT